MRNPTLRKNRLSLRRSGFKQGLVDYGVNFIDSYGILADEGFEPGAPSDDFEAIRSDWEVLGSHIQKAIDAVGKGLKVKTNGARR